MISLSPIQSTTPVAFKGFSIDGKEVNPQFFVYPKGTNWLSSLGFQVTNRTSQTIEGISVQLVFLDTGNGSHTAPFFAYPYEWGSTRIRRKNAKIVGDRDAYKSLDLLPGVSATLYRLGSARPGLSLYSSAASPCSATASLL
jgi:hypothetical protein